MSLLEETFNTQRMLVRTAFFAGMAVASAGLAVFAVVMAAVYK